MYKKLHCQLIKNYYLYDFKIITYQTTLYFFKNYIDLRIQIIHI